MDLVKIPVNINILSYLIIRPLRITYSREVILKYVSINVDVDTCRRHQYPAKECLPGWRGTVAITKNAMKDSVIGHLDGVT